MSEYEKAVEALERIRLETSNVCVNTNLDIIEETLKQTKENVIEQAQKEHDELEELKRVPTAEEVCEAIQENLTLKKIVYNEKDNSFGLEYGIPPLYLPLVESKERFITYFPFATPKILILIGRFYA
jgi:hypothetical protein